MRESKPTLRAFERLCRTCGGVGEVDSGAPDPQGYFINVTCPTCNGRGVVLDRAAIWNRLKALQDTAAYAAPELQPHLMAQKAELLTLLEEYQ